MTIFDVLVLAFVGICGWYGAQLGHSALGVIGGWLGAFVGGSLGWIIGRVPFLIALRTSLRTLTKTSTDELRTQLRTQYFTAHLVLRELLRRGADVDAELPVIVQLLCAESVDRRRFGLAGLRIAFPKLAAQLTDYKPSESLDSCLAKVARITPPTNSSSRGRA